MFQKAMIVLRVFLLGHSLLSGSAMALTTGNCGTREDSYSSRHYCNFCLFTTALKYTVTTFSH